MIINREQYLHELTKDMGGKDLLKPSEVENLKKCLDIALDLRKFEIELYWKRTTYFWGINAAILAFYGVMLTSKKDVDPFFLIIISAFGILASACSYYLNRGGKFWQENWEMHVNYLSSFINGNLFKIVPKKNEDHFSVSRINLFFSGAIYILWLFIFVYYLTNFMDLDLGLTSINLKGLFIYRIFIVLLLFMLLYYVTRPYYIFMIILILIMMCFFFVFIDRILNLERNLDLNYIISFTLILTFVALVVVMILRFLENSFFSDKEKYIKFDDQPQ